MYMGDFPKEDLQGKGLPQGRCATLYLRIPLRKEPPVSI